jgi:uncharacterized protein YbjT (DUF2867 family)
MMGKTALVIGATGLVGEQLVLLLLDHPEFEKVVVFGRRKSGLNHTKLEEKLINFDQPESWNDLVKGDVAFSSLGTTIKTAKTKENQYRVDYTYQFEFAKAASQNGVPAFVLVSSLGADPKSSVFYSRMKGELDEAVAKLPFRKTIVVRPSILDGNRKEKRPLEKISLAIMRGLTKIVLKKYKPTPVDLLAARMISLSLDEQAGIRIIEASEIN